MLDAVERLCPQLTILFNLFYTVEGACFFMVDGVVETIWSAEGARMGCPLGSFGFDLALQAVLERCATRDLGLGLIVRALTDDANLAVQLPRERSAAAAVLLRLRAALEAMEADALQQLGLSLNLSKCALLLPAGHVLLDSDLRCFEGTKVCAAGMKVAGAPIGDDD